MTPIVYAPPESRRDRMSPTLCLLVVASLVCVPWQSAKSQQTHGSPSSPTPVKVADAVCAKCHQQIYEDYIDTPMANASGLAVNGTIPGGFTDEISRVQFNVFKRDGATWLSYDRPGSSLDGQQKLAYFLGSGAHARTYLYSRNGYWFESPAV
ncbi:MAG TPA: hypothetical protein VFW94_00170, partial [Candidatus Acidoferrales bacterium]|nr:hypothetical protein [Candidatus Acidoferrales bacterium]